MIDTLFEQALRVHQASAGQPSVLPLRQGQVDAPSAPGDRVLIGDGAASGDGGSQQGVVLQDTDWADGCGQVGLKERAHPAPVEMEVEIDAVPRAACVAVPLSAPVRRVQDAPTVGTNFAPLSTPGCGRPLSAHEGDCMGLSWDGATA